MHDEKLRAIAREIAEGVAGAEERYIVANRQVTPLAVALENFAARLGEAWQKHMSIAYPETAHLDPQSFVVDPAGKKNTRIVRIQDDGRYRSCYCFVDNATGTILMSGGWKAPEPKRIPRGNIYALQPLTGCGPHGVAYVAKSARHCNYGWAPGVLAAESVAIEAGPTLPGVSRKA